MKPHLIAAIGAVAAGVAFTTTARADDTNYYYQPAPVGAETSGYSGPNRALLTTGLVAFTGAYVPAVIVAAESDRSVDHHLYVPVVGPWLDLANRPGCGIGSIGCDTETTNKLLIILSGVFQGVGVLGTVGAFIFPEHAVVATASNDDSDKDKKEKNVATHADKPTFHLTPAQFGTAGYGLAAFGGF
jgi:hypothetical protein